MIFNMEDVWDLCGFGRVTRDNDIMLIFRRNPQGYCCACKHVYVIGSQRNRKNNYLIFYRFLNCEFQCNYVSDRYRNVGDDYVFPVIS